MNFDPAKDALNIEKHGYTLADADKVFSGPSYGWEDTRQNYGESRFNLMGLISGMPVILTYTCDDDGGNARAISLRPATISEVKTHGHKLT